MGDVHRCDKCRFWEQATPYLWGHCKTFLAAYLLRDGGASLPSATMDPDDGEDCRAFRPLKTKEAEHG